MQNLTHLQIDYINLTYTCAGADVYDARAFLDDIGAGATKIIAKVQLVLTDTKGQQCVATSFPDQTIINDALIMQTSLSIPGTPGCSNCKLE